MIVTCLNSQCGKQVDLAESESYGLIRCPHCGGTFQIRARCPETERALQIQTRPSERKIIAPVVASSSFVIFDLETTGLSPADSEIIQIAAIRFRDGAAVAGETFVSYCRPLGRISSFISNYTGITDWDVRDAPRPIEALVEFSRFVGDSVIMAHNGHRFDIKFLEATCAVGQVPTRTVHSIDTISLSKRLFGTVRGTGHGLDRVLQRLGLNPDRYQRHDARGDIMALADAVSIMWRRLELDAGCSVFPRRPTLLPVNLRAV